MGERRPWRCRRGWHAWRFVSMSDLHLLDAPGVHWICTLVERCDRCGLRVTRKHASPPKRPRVAASRPDGEDQECLT